MANPRAYPSIPDPTSDGDLLQVVRSLKQAVEILTGQRGASPAVTVYPAVEPPNNPGVGDLWVRTTDHRVYMWDGLQWVPLTT